MRKVTIVQASPYDSYEAVMDEKELYKLEEQAKDNIRKTKNWNNVPKWCNHIVAAVEYGNDRANVYLEPHLCSNWDWEENFTNPVKRIERVIAFHRGTSNL